MHTATGMVRLRSPGGTAHGGHPRSARIDARGGPPVPRHPVLGARGPPVPARHAARPRRRRRRRARADAVGAGHQRGAARRHRIRGVRARRPRLRARAGRGQRQRPRVPDAAGPGARRTGRTRPAHRARAGRRVGHRDATGPARQDGVVLGGVGRASVLRGTGRAAGGAGWRRPRRPRRPRRWKAGRPGPYRACGRCSTGCATRSWPPTSRARSVTSTRRPRISWAGPADPWSGGRSSTSCPSHSPRR